MREDLRRLPTHLPVPSDRAAQDPLPRDRARVHRFEQCPLLSLVMSQILDQGVASILSNVLFNIAADKDPKDSRGPQGKKRRKSSVCSQH